MNFNCWNIRVILVILLLYPSKNEVSFKITI
jgi:hypothetical protein